MDLSSSGVEGAIVYESGLPHGDGFTLPMALTLASQERLLPLTPAVLTKHGCLSKLLVKRDLRKMPELHSRASAWRWAIDTLLPNASKNTTFNIYHYDPRYKTDPQSNATLGNL
eukprot:SAG31_NODE_15671_length_743_cov_1.436335_1_plen_113_part_10